MSGRFLLCDRWCACSENRTHLYSSNYLCGRICGVALYRQLKEILWNRIQLSFVPRYSCDCVNMLCGHWINPEKYCCCISQYSLPVIERYWWIMAWDGSDQAGTCYVFNVKTSNMGALYASVLVLPQNRIWQCTIYRKDVLSAHPFYFEFGPA